MSECSICRNPRTAETERKIREQQLTVRDAARELNTTYPSLWRHLKFHAGGQVSTDTEARVDTLQLLEEITSILSYYLSEIRDLPVDMTNTRMLTLVARELRGTIMDLERLTGRLRAAPFIQLQEITIFNEQILGFLISDQCEACRIKAREFLEKLQTRKGMLPEPVQALGDLVESSRENS